MGENKNIDSLTCISSLKDKVFNVEDYQRGYKWEQQQVLDLLNDVREFVQNPINEGKIYCLQPIVVIEKENSEVELVDGQQRLTTLFIILAYLENNTFQIKYNTREGSRLFLEKIISTKDKRLISSEICWETFIKVCPELENEDENVEVNNVDNYHFYNAYNYIHEWFESIGSDFKIPECFLDRVGVIYYIPEIENNQTPEKLFRNINSNKIELTNSELIKGVLVINGSKGEDDIHTLSKQLDIAKEWDKIESKLHDEKLWYFLKPEKPYRNRIEFLFELYDSIYNKESNIEKENKTERKDKYYLYHALNSKDLKTVWLDTVQIYNIITEWFDDSNLELCHFVGYAIATKIYYERTVEKLIELLNKKNKTVFLTELKKDILRLIGDDNKIKNASYRNNKNEVTRILLLHNILSLCKRNHNTNSLDWSSKFRFDLFNYENWSLEHIHAQNEAPRDSFENLKLWVLSAIKSLKLSSKWDKIQSDYIDLDQLSTCYSIDDWSKISKKDPKLSILLERIDNFQLEIAEGLSDEDKDNINNMALLSQSINSKIGNGYFNEKRIAVIECDKQGMYILPTTKNVFLKYYSTDSTNPYEWTNEDKNAYLNDIVAKINDFRKENM